MDRATNSQVGLCVAEVVPALARARVVLLLMMLMNGSRCLLLHGLVLGHLDLTFNRCSGSIRDEGVLTKVEYLTSGMLWLVLLRLRLREGGLMDFMLKGRLGSSLLHWQRFEEHVLEG